MDRKYDRKRRKKYWHKPSREQNVSPLKKIYWTFQNLSSRHPILSVGVYSFIALILFRIAIFDASFRPYQSFDEVRFWLAIIAFIMVIVAILALVAWWRRHVPDIHIKGTGDVTWRNR